MKTHLGTKTGLALAAASAISMCVPMAAHADYRGSRGWSGHSSGRHYGAGAALLGLGVAAAILAPRYAYPRYYAPAYYPPTYYEPAYSYYPPAPTYIQQAPQAQYQPQYQSQYQPQYQPQIQQQVQPQANYSYFCSEANGYYPNVQQCPGGWQRLAPQ